jgi:Fic family protein
MGQSQAEDHDNHNEAKAVAPFVPPLLPPRIPLTTSLMSLLADAERALGGLNAIANYAPNAVPNTAILLLPMMVVDATHSSAIEGTQTTTEEAFEAALEVPEAAVGDRREVANYLQAMHEGWKALDSLPFSLRLVRQLHGVLMQGARGESRAPGEFRRLQVHVGPPGAGAEVATYMPPPPQLVADLMADWERFAHADPPMTRLMQCAVLHAQFEMIHPFMDGNGRIGRLLMSLFLVSRGHLSRPVLFLSSYFEKHRADYYRSLLAISREGDWSSWLSLFLRAVSVQSAHVLHVAQAMLALREDLRAKLQAAKASASTLALLDMLFQNPFTTIAHAAQGLAVAPHTATKAIAKLQELGLVEETTGRQWSKRYRATRILRLIEQVGSPPDDEPPDQPAFRFD